MNRQTLLTEILTFNNLRSQVSKKVSDGMLSEVIGKIRKTIRGIKGTSKRGRFFPRGTPIGGRTFSSFRPLNIQERVVLQRMLHPNAVTNTPTGMRSAINYRVAYSIVDPFTTCVVIDHEGTTRFAGCGKRSISDAPNTLAGVNAFHRALAQGWITYR